MDKEKAKELYKKISTPEEKSVDLLEDIKEALNTKKLIEIVVKQEPVSVKVPQPIVNIETNIDEIKKPLEEIHKILIEMKEKEVSNGVKLLTIDGKHFWDYQDIPRGGGLISNNGTGGGTGGGDASAALQTAGNATLTSIALQSSRFKRVLKAEASLGEEIRIDEIAAGDQYNGIAVDLASTSTGNLWDVVRMYRTAGVATRIRFRSGINWDDRLIGW